MSRKKRETPNHVWDQLLRHKEEKAVLRKRLSQTTLCLIRVLRTIDSWVDQASDLDVQNIREDIKRNIRHA